MRIGILQGAFLPVPPIMGGAVEKMWFLLAQEFAARGHSVCHVSRRHATLPDKETIGGVSHIRVNGSQMPKSVLLLKLLDFLYTLRARSVFPPLDILVTNTFSAPLVMVDRKGIYVDVQRMPKGQMRLYRKAARLRANSSSVRDAILHEEPLAENRTSLIPNPLTFKTSDTLTSLRKDKVLLYVGRLHPEKGVSLLLKAFTAAKRQGALPGWRMELIGPADVAHGGGGENWFNALLQTCAHPDVHCHGPVFDVELLNEHYRRASLFVYPSLAEKGETFGIAPLEAMAWGAVPIVSDLACFKDFIHHNVNGFSFNHRGKESTEELARVLVHAGNTTLDPFAISASAVRTTHSIPKIAGDFLADFERVNIGLPPILP